MSDSDTNSAGMPRIAVDAMGGDYAPQEIVKGAVEGSRLHGVKVLLVGDPSEVEVELKKVDREGAWLEVVPSQGWVVEGEHPVLALRRMPKASVAVATAWVKTGQADAMVTMGSTGAAMASAKLGLGMMEGVDRPCLGGPFLGLAPHTAILDLGSNIDCRPHQLLSFAIMGCVFARKFFGIESPRVGLLSVGSEEGKGNRQVREAYELFKRSEIRFVGNVEGTDLLTDRAHVVVCDGFVGNILLKFAEALGDGISAHLNEKLQGKLAPSDIAELKEGVWELTNRSRRLSGPLFGVKGNVIVGHGSSRSGEVAGAVGMAKMCVEMDLANSMEAELAALKAKVAG